MFICLYGFWRGVVAAHLCLRHCVLILGQRHDLHVMCSYFVKNVYKCYFDLIWHL
jgi:hypothetical protein